MENEESAKEKRTYPREKMRALCRFELDGEVHSGFLLNLSARGLFLQTRLRLPAGTELDLKIRDLGDHTINVLARVVHLTGSHRATASVETGGMGFEILNAPEALYKLLYDLEGP